MSRDPFDHRPLDRHRAEHRQHRPQRARGLEAAVGEQPVIADRDAQPGERVGDREDEQVLPMQGSAPRKPPRQTERGRRQDKHERPNDSIRGLVLDRDHFGDGRRAHHAQSRSANCTSTGLARPAIESESAWGIATSAVVGTSEVRSCCRLARSRPHNGCPPTSKATPRVKPGQPVGPLGRMAVRGACVSRVSTVSRWPGSRRDRRDRLARGRTPRTSCPGVAGCRS